MPSRRAYREGRVPIASAEGFIRQVIGWREYVWGLYWRWMPDYRDENALGADRDLPPAFTTAGATSMRCVASCVARRRATRLGPPHPTAHGARQPGAPRGGRHRWQVTDWMWESFVDGAEWVMVPNVDRHGAARRRRPDGDQALRRRRRLHRPHERLLQGLRATTASSASAPPHARSPPSTGTSCSGTQIASPATRGSWSRCGRHKS